jgi:hypothetical protein
LEAKKLEEKNQEYPLIVFRELKKNIEEYKYLNTNPIEDAINCIIYSRIILKNSYAYGFFLQDEKDIHLLECIKILKVVLQSSLEKETETLSWNLSHSNVDNMKPKDIIQTTLLLKKNSEQLLKGLKEGLTKF